MRIPVFIRSMGKHAVLFLKPFALSLSLVALVPGARADIVYLPDGFTLQGKIKRESTNFVDPQSGQSVTTAKLNGFFMIDNGARRIVFSQVQVQEVDDRDVHAVDDFLKLTRPYSRPGRMLPYPITRIADISPWNDRWERTFTIDATVQGQSYRIALPQRLGELTPVYARVDGLKYTSSAFYLTSELGPEAVLKLLATHPDLTERGRTGDDLRRWKRFRFLVQAGWFDLAEKELDRIRKDFANQKEKIEQAEGHLRKLRAQQLFDEIEIAQKAGRHRWAQEALAQFPTAAADERLLTYVRNLKAKYEAGTANLELARRFLKDLPAHITDERTLLTEAAQTIRDELNLDNAGRLETFVRFAQQAERRATQGLKPSHPPEQILALAVSSWLLGNSSAQLDVPFARRLWQTRKFVLDYQKTPIAGTRQLRLQEYQKGPALAFDEIAQVIRFLPPPEPENTNLKPGAELEAPGLGPPLRYLIQLPPEYTHSRPYPVLFVLHQAGEKPLDMLRRWSLLGARHGYILVAPEWETSLNSGYNFTAEEQVGVTGVLRDLRRRFQVDSDRVFLYGYGEAGVMAYDVGLGHPDLFAGIVVMCARPRYFARKYWCNAQYLPFYIVDGDRDGDNPQDTRRQFEYWVPRGYPALYIEYKGRGAEWYGAELPTIFDWMDRKTRAAAFPELGKAGNGGPFGEEFQSMRQSDNRFYWLSSDAIDTHHVNSVARWNQLTTPATFQGRLGEGNYLLVHARGLNQLTVWLGNGMVDFSKPVSINVQPRSVGFTRLVRPDLGTLLEDFAERGDRQRLFWARVDFNLR
jgi:hypothetical protein